MADEKPLDKVCMHCGEILTGPNAGEKIEPGGAHVQLPEGEKERTYKGRRLSHCGGHGCPEEEEADTRFWTEYYETHPRKKKPHAAKGQRVNSPLYAEKAKGTVINPQPRVIGPPATREGKRQRKPPPIDPMKQTLPYKKLAAWEKAHSTRLPKPPKL